MCVGGGNPGYFPSFICGAFNLKELELIDESQ